jgi:hypothetical protein
MPKNRCEFRTTGTVKIPDILLIQPKKFFTNQRGHTLYN